MGLRNEVITKIRVFQNTLWALELYLDFFFFNFQDDIFLSSCRWTRAGGGGGAI